MNKFIKSGLLALSSLLFSVGCSSSQVNDVELVVFAAASLTDAFRDVAAAFEAGNPSVGVTLNLSGSQRLSTQLEHGASADLFASADWQQMDKALEAGLLAEQPVSFTTNRLVVITYAGLEHDIDLMDLAEPGTRVVIADGAVPVGGYARTVLDNLQADPQLGLTYAESVMNNVVSEEANVRVVVQKVALGEADAGIVYATDAMSPDIAPDVKVVPIPDAYNVIATYPIAVLKDSSQRELAQEFIDFLLSSDGQQLLENHGFGANAPISSEASLYLSAQYR